MPMTALQIRIFKFIYSSVDAMVFTRKGSLAPAVFEPVVTNGLNEEALTAYQDLRNMGLVRKEGNHIFMTDEGRQERNQIRIDEAINQREEARVAVETMGFNCPEDEPGENEREYERRYAALEKLELEAESVIKTIKAQIAQLADPNQEGA